jgi:iron(III) transport system substrate-binding protein
MGSSLVSRAQATWRLALPWVLLPALLLSGCSRPGGGPNSITLYNGQHPQLTAALVHAFEAQTGISVRVRTDDGIVLADQIIEEGSSSPADVYVTENSPELVLLTERHLLARLPASIVAQVPSQYDSPTGDWVGLALRVSALAYAPSLVSASQLPQHLLDLGSPPWRGKVAMAPTDSDFVPLVGAVIAAYGTSAARRWLSGLKANATVYQDDEAVVDAVDKGHVAVGIVNQYYWYRLRLEQGVAGTRSRLYLFPNHDVGSIANVSGAAVLASSRHRRAAERFVDFLVSSQAAQILAAGDDFEYPARPGASANPALPPLAQIDPARLGIAALGDDRPAAALLQQVGLT